MKYQGRAQILSNKKEGWCRRKHDVYVQHHQVFNIKMLESKSQHQFFCAYWLREI